MRGMYGICCVMLQGFCGLTLNPNPSSPDKHKLYSAKVKTETPSNVAQNFRLEPRTKKSLKTFDLNPVQYNLYQP